MQWPLQQGQLRKKIYLWLFGWRYLNEAWAIHYTTEVEQKQSEQAGVTTSGFVVPNCMDFSEFDTLPESGFWRKKFGFPPDDPLLLFLGRLESRKGVDLSLQAFARVKDKVPEAQFAIAGPGSKEYVRQLKSLSSDLGITDAVTFTGYLDAQERLRALGDADVFILTSHTENFAIAAVEAMAAQTPVLLSEEVGVAEKAEAAGAGVSVSLDISEIAEELGQLLESQTLRENIGENGPSHVQITYRPEVVAGQMTKSIREQRAG